MQELEESGGPCSSPLTFSNPVSDSWFPTVYLDLQCVWGGVGVSPRLCEPHSYTQGLGWLCIRAVLPEKKGTEYGVAIKIIRGLEQFPHEDFYNVWGESNEEEKVSKRGNDKAV